MACDALGIHGGSVMWLFNPFMRETAKSTQNMRISSPKPNAELKKGPLTSYSVIVNYLLLTYASDDLIANADEALQRFEQGT